ncbi:hypothetical protein MLD52_02820 [Puniceicoccaceae bacterium K14]|nr:hypothetical protein [Puniceicoccaceae bacterium K14]
MSNNKRKISPKTVTFLAILVLTATISYNAGLKKSSALRESTNEPPVQAPPTHPIPDKLTKEEPIGVAQETVGLTEDIETFDLRTALIPLDKLRGSDRLNYLNDLFTYLANNHSPDEALRIASSLERENDYALRVLITEWHLKKRNLPLSQENAFRRRMMSLTGGDFGIEVQLSEQISRLSLDESVKSAWIHNFSDHISRSQIQGILDAKEIASNPEKLLENKDDWTDWEQQNYRNSVLNLWAQRSPKQAFDWYTENSSALNEEYSQDILAQWAKRNPSELANYTANIEDYNLRQTAIKTAAASLALSNTTKAMAWADSISDTYEREVAYEAIYENSVKGIGARISSSDGFPEIRDILANGPLVDSGITEGDRLISSIESDGTTHDLYGKDLSSVVSALSGEPDSVVQLRILRKNEETGSLEEHLIETKRDLLIINRFRGK